MSLPRIILRDLAPEQILDHQDPPTPPVSDLEASSQKSNVHASPKDKGESPQVAVYYSASLLDMCVLWNFHPSGRNSPRPRSYRGGAHAAGCLRHGTISNAQAVKAVYLLMGGAAASSAIGYLGTCSLSNMEARAPDMPLNADFVDMGAAQAYQAVGPSLDSPHYNSFDFEMADSDFDAFDCGGFTF